MSMKIKEEVLDIIAKMDFSESVVERRDCPKCGTEGSVERRVSKEPQQPIKGRWYMETCENPDCPYWDCGFT